MTATWTPRPAPSPGRVLRDHLAAELLKATSTRLLTRGVGLALALPPVLAALLGAAMGSRESFCATPGNECRNTLALPDETVATIGVLGDGVPGAGLTVLTVLAAVLLLAEVRTNTLSTAFLVTPRRLPVVLAKIALVVLVVVPTTFVATLASGVVFDVVAGPAAARVEPLSAAAIGVAARTTYVVLAFSLMALGVAALTRHAGVTLGLVVAWPAFVEPLVPAVLPHGEHLARFGPFANALEVVGTGSGVVPWGAGVSAAYVGVVAVVLLGAGVVRLLRVDLARTT
ncbi:hypothetical protein INN71_12050 [Nocardioides sp. ChNu-153]|uniref:hypothetical protein n=1 Tax=Nocardioides sp. ChNu-153 TaxID=2779364 RepID=UPI002650E806|nr:hypothetical protein [Nocardioides sp. ChNu-153]MDN7122122.1 hypothetical protein [Nocardioides sp. ChNu-153]